MRLIAIANILKQNDTVGIRVLDIDSKQVKDVPIDNIKSVISGGTIQIRNLKIDGGRVVGSNGSIDRLPKIKDSQLIGKSSLIVISQLGDIGYRVSDYKGTIINVRNSEIVQYAKVNGIANGKVVNKDGKEFISSIEGSYQVENIVNNQTKKETEIIIKKYTGELVQNKDRLRPLIIGRVATSTIDKLNKQIKTNNNTVLFNFVNNKLCIEDIPDFENGELRLLRRDIKNDGVYHIDGYTLGGLVRRSLYISNDEEDIRESLRGTDLKWKLENSINQMKSRRKGHGRVDKQTGVLIPTAKEQYDDIIVFENIDKSKDTFSNIAEEDIEKCINELKVMNIRLTSVIDFGVTNIALVRECKDTGVDYMTLERKKQLFGELYELVKVTVEDIYSNSEKYSNVIVNESEMIIVGLDGVYRYDMKRVHKAYGRQIIKSVRAAKAKVFDPEYEEVINGKGELSSLKTTLKVVTVPKGVKRILKEAIKGQEKNRVVVFSESITDCENDFFIWNKYEKPLDEIEIRCGKTASIKIIKCMRSRLDGHGTIRFSRNVTPEEYMMVILQRYGDYEIVGPNIDSELVVKAIQVFIAKELNNFKVLREPLKLDSKGRSWKGSAIKFFGLTAYENFTHSYRVLKYLWNSKLRQLVTAEEQENINKLIIEADKRIADIQQKLEVETNKMYK